MMKRLFVFLTLAGVLSVWPGNVPAQFRVLLYHAHPNMYFTESLYRSHLEFLKQNDYHTVTPDMFLDWLEHEHPLPIRPLLISFDDNYIDVYLIAYPLMREFGFRGVNFTITNSVGLDWGTIRYCDWNQIREMDTAGVFLSESHTQSHPQLPALSEADQRKQISGSRTSLTTELGRSCDYIAYPYGEYNDSVLSLCVEAGYRAGFAVEGGLNYHTTPLFQLQRIGVDGASLATFRGSIGFNDLPPAPPGPGWTIDNDDVNFFIAPAEWELETPASGNGYGKNYYWQAEGDGSRKARWAAYLPHGGLYRVHAWWPSASRAATNAPYEIHHRLGVARLRMDQTANGGRWNRLGEYYFSETQPAEIFLSDDADGRIHADGIWFEPIGGIASGWMFH